MRQHTKNFVEISGCNNFRITVHIVGLLVIQYFQKAPDLQYLFVHFGFHRINTGAGGISHGQKLLYAGGGCIPSSPSGSATTILRAWC